MEDVKIIEYPNCDVCKMLGMEEIRKAKYDGRTIYRSSWAYMCEEHFKEVGVGIGTGKGQRLIIKEDS